MDSIINFFSTVTGTELSYVLVVVSIVDVSFAAYAVRSFRSTPLILAALFKLSYALVPALMTWGERYLSTISEASSAGQHLILFVASVYFVMIFIAELVSIMGYYRALNPTASNLLSRLADRLAPEEVKDKMKKLGLTDLFEEDKKEEGKENKK